MAQLDSLSNVLRDFELSRSTLMAQLDSPYDLPLLSNSNHMSIPHHFSGYGG